jgi:hypothetical protein
MRAVATKANQESVIQEAALVVADDPIVVRAEGVEYRAERAASCLMKPAAGDEVLVALLPDRRAFVLAVLTRPEARGAELSVEGDLRLRAEGGRVELSSSEGISMATPRGISMVAGSVSVRAVAATLASEAITFVGKAVAGELDRVKLVARTFDSIVDRFTQRAKRAVRIVEESDHLRAERIDYAAEKSVTLHGENALVTAKQLVKVDGGQIHLG